MDIRINVNVTALELEHDVIYLLCLATHDKKHKSVYVSYSGNVIKAVVL